MLSYPRSTDIELSLQVGQVHIHLTVYMPVLLLPSFSFFFIDDVHV